MASTSTSTKRGFRRSLTASTCSVSPFLSLAKRSAIATLSVLVVESDWSVDCEGIPVDGEPPSSSSSTRMKSSSSLILAASWILRLNLAVTLRRYIKSNFPIGNSIFQLVQGAGFEPAKHLTADLESAPFDHSGTPA